jgi:hypothetical protein
MSQYVVGRGGWISAPFSSDINDYIYFRAAIQKINCVPQCNVPSTVESQNIGSDSYGYLQYECIRAHVITAELQVGCMLCCERKQYWNNVKMRQSHCQSLVPACSAVRWYCSQRILKSEMLSLFYKAWKYAWSASESNMSIAKAIQTNSFPLSIALNFTPHEYMYIHSEHIKVLSNVNCWQRKA